MDLKLRVWRQEGPTAPGRFEDYAVPNVSPDMSFLELFDVLNEQLLASDQEPVAFDHDCREGICGSCSMMINGRAHGPETGTATCQLHVRQFKDGDQITVEPWRARAFPIIRDLVIDRSPLDRIIEAGGFITAPTGAAPDANLILVPKRRRTRRWTPPRASVAEPVWPRARTAPRSCSPRPRSPTSVSCRRVSPSATSVSSTWWRRWRATSARARCTASARRRARRRSASTSSRCSTATT